MFYFDLRQFVRLIAVLRVEFYKMTRAILKNAQLVCCCCVNSIISNDYYYFKQTYYYNAMIINCRILIGFAMHTQKK
jgi:hypothetical protein